MQKRLSLVLALATALLLSLSTTTAAAPPLDEGEGLHGKDVTITSEDPGDPAQHGPGEGHLPASRENVRLVSKTAIPERERVPGRIADVAHHRKHAYLGAWQAGLPPGECTGGAFAYDISNRRNPELVSFMKSHRNTYATEGVFAMHADTPFFTGDILVISNEICGPGGIGGITLWDVTNPNRPELLSEGFGDNTWGDVDSTDTRAVAHQAHSALAWQDGNKLYAVLIDNEELLDVDIMDITNPRNPVLISETGIPEWPGLEVTGHGDNPGSHDFMVKKIGGNWRLMVAYWDAGWVELDINDPTNPTFLGQTTYAPCDQLIPTACPPEGNAHQNEWNRNGSLFIGTDEDFSPRRLEFEVTTGPHAGEWQAGEFGWTKSVATLPNATLHGPTVFGGYGCPGDRGNIPTPEQAGLQLEPGESAILVLQRGPVNDPNDPGEACFFSEKVETAELLGYDAAIVANHHNGAAGGEAPDAFICGGQGHPYDPQIPGLCIGHRLMHLLFGYPPDYTLPYPVGDPQDLEPDIGDLGDKVQAVADFDGWGYARLFNAETMREIGQYAIDEALAPAFADDFGDLTVHEVAVEKKKQLRRFSYFSWYSGGLRIAKFNRFGAFNEVGHFIDQGGNDFWGIELAGFGNRGNRIIAASDRDFGLYLFRYTGD